MQILDNLVQDLAYGMSVIVLTAAIVYACYLVVRKLGGTE